MERKQNPGQALLQTATPSRIARPKMSLIRATGNASYTRLRTPSQKGSLKAIRKTTGGSYGEGGRRPAARRIAARSFQDGGRPCSGRRCGGAASAEYGGGAGSPGGCAAA